VDIVTSTLNPDGTGTLFIKITADDSGLPPTSTNTNQIMDQTWGITLYEPTHEQTRIDVAGTFTFTENVVPDATRTAELQSFRLVQISSMFIDSARHDVDEFRFLNSAGLVTFLYNPALVNTLLPLMPSALHPSTGILDSLHTDDVGQPNGNTPSYKILMGTTTGPMSGPITPRAFFSASQDVNDDNLGLWLHQQPLSMIPQGTIGSISYTVLATTDPAPDPPAQPVLSVSPVSRDVAKNAETTMFSISNTGAGTMLWTTAVTSGGSWLSITSGASGTNAGTIDCSFTANTGISARTATIRVTATDAAGSPQYVTITQAGQESLTISGSVKTASGSIGVSGVTITFNDGGGTAKTDVSGDYSVILPNDYSGTAMPSKTGYTFSPASKSYSNVTADKTGENYTAAPLTNPIIVSNSIDGIDVVKITDMSCLPPDVGKAITVRAWDKDGQEISAAGYATPLSIINHGTTSIRGEDLEGRFPDGVPVAYTFSVESSKMFITNINNSIDGAVRVPIIYSNGLSNFVSNSIGSRNTIKVTDMSGTIPTGGIAITAAAWDASGKAILESTSAETLRLYSHGTTIISGSSLTERFPSGVPMTYEFTIASPKLVISNVKNSSDGTLNIPTVYTVGVSSFVANSIGFRNSIYISDFSGTLDVGGAAIKVRAWDVSGTEIPESESVRFYTISNYATVKINGAELASRFSSGSPMTYEFTVDSPKVVITNVKSSSDGSINIPTVYTSGITNFTTNYVSDLNTIKITDMSGGVPTSGACITITTRDVDGNIIAESEDAAALKLLNHGTTTIEGDDLKKRFPGSVPVTYEFSIGSSSVVVTNLTKSLDGAINIPAVFTFGPYGGI
jgi:hypothetical protein